MFGVKALLASNRKAYIIMKDRNGKYVNVKQTSSVPLLDIKDILISRK